MDDDLFKKTAEAPAKVLDQTFVGSRSVIKQVNKQKAVKKARHFWQILGPGLTTGASDDDPAGIATYSQAGAGFGYNFLFLSLLTFPLMGVIQEMCARIGLVTKKGLAWNIKKHFSPRSLYISTVLLFLANIFNIGANLGAMASSTRLFLPGVNYGILVTFFAILTFILQLSIPYRKYAQVLKWLSLILISYIATAFFIDIEWKMVFEKLVNPQLKFDRSHILMLCALFGTTISPYLFFWQTSQEVEETETPKTKEIIIDKRRIREMRVDVWFGMLLSNLVMFFIILTSATILNFNGITEITSASEAAEALKPLAGEWATLLFTAGIIGTGLLAIPILAGSASYALSESLGWKNGMGKKLHQAYAFYGIIIISLLMGLGLNFIGLDPIKALIFSAIINGLIAPLILIQIVLIANNEKVMGKMKNGPLGSIVGWIAFIIMFAVGLLTIGLGIFSYI